MTYGYTKRELCQGPPPAPLTTQRVTPRIPLLSLAAFILWSQTVSADVLEGRVVAIADGDTITLLDSNHQQHRIRIGGIDAPEQGLLKSSTSVA